MQNAVQPGGTHPLALNRAPPSGPTVLAQQRRIRSLAHRDNARPVHRPYNKPGLKKETS
ncbi:hypothetical protein [Streptomyces sp. NPDC002215]|uniref:hypothetical protein n=1 Tax=Streptomyces sp. NPDC002215 TaxID=3154412 RepID=UPI0033275153